MFEDGARIDDIMNVLRRPTLDDEEEEKKNRRISDAAIRYDSKRIFGDDNIKIEFAGHKNLGGL